MVGCGLWKFTNNLLTCKYHVSKVKDTTHSACSQYLDNKESSYFRCKISIKKSLIVSMMNIWVLLYHIKHAKKKVKANGEK